MSEYDNQAGVAERVIRDLALSQAVAETCSILLDLISTDDAIKAELGRKFEPALSDLVRIEIAPIDEEFGAFSIAEGEVRLNEVEVARLIAYVLDDMKSQLGDNLICITKDDVRETLEEAVSLFALHELRHRTQGVQEFSTVQLLKAIDGRARIATFDIQADRDAAVALAATKAKSTSSAEFHDAYQRALFYSIQYFFRIYPANAKRPDKVCRVAALMFMLARLEIYRKLGHLQIGGSKTALSVSISGDKRSLAVFENEPEQRLLCASNDVNDLPLFVANIEEGNLDEALGQAFLIVTSIGLN
ncbi:hypothetical protein [Qipengyuania vesicularis]|uniref:hypothetical protein n=1 Tax=Qipengyuania vesicularis TaxID=2867232 RepID=UPI001C88B91D|nr:hypothetical protein [Qipengyuania vesicularis]MBX7526627.1 hypothetical protein [Qipengyuania vesicularis]